MLDHGYIVLAVYGRWCPDDDEVFIPGKVVRETKGKIDVELRDGSQKVGPVLCIISHTAVWHLAATSVHPNDFGTILGL